MERGFRYQTGEIDKVIDEITENNFAEMDIDREDELEQVLTELADIERRFADYSVEYTVAGMEDKPEWHSRVVFEDKAYIDFYLVDQPEESYDEIFWG